MDDLVDVLRKEIDGVEFVASGSCEPLSICLEAADEIERLRAEVAALRQDAARYRWLRDCTDDALESVQGDRTHIPAGAELDARIDAALAAQKD